jgi:chromate reductase, NAD(P)H dehydrogenase (quinone)
VTQPSPQPFARLSLRVLGIPGSLRRWSHNRVLLRLAQEHAPDHVEVCIWDGLERIPPFNEDLEHAGRIPAAVLEFRRAIRQADGLLIATPEYNRSVPGQLKNALDWASRPSGMSELVGKPVAVTGASPSAFGAISAQADLRKILSASGGRPLDTSLAIGHAVDRLDLRNPDTATVAAVRDLLTNLAGAINHAKVVDWKNTQLARSLDGQSSARKPIGAAGD